jgi:glycine dehydrogenase subunit 1
MKYIPHSEAEIEAMLQSMDLRELGDLFRHVPEAVRLPGELPMPEGQSELEVDRYFRELAKLNTGVLEYSTFLGAGAYNHHIPAVIDSIISRAEFYTAYTPYQAEVSQGTLQAIFEYQSMVSMLTGMDVTNASMYDGATAVAEAVLMANRVRKGTKALVATSLHPFYRWVLQTYVQNFSIELVDLPFGEDGRVSAESLRDTLDDDVFTVLVQSPNFFGVIEDLETVAGMAHDKNALLIAAFTEALSLPVLKSPGDCGADIVAGEGQSFGIPLSFGGPYLGIFSTNSKHVRKMPGRVVGLTTDSENRRGFVLTLSTREQHIRREKATSNICTNQGLCALMAAVYLAHAGKSGLRLAAEQNLAKAHFAAEALETLPGVRRMFNGPFFNEFVVRLPVDPHEFARYCSNAKLVPGVPLKWFYPDMPNALLVCVTEMNTRDEIEGMVNLLGEYCSKGGLL